MISTIFVTCHREIDHAKFWRGVPGVRSLWVLRNDGCQYFSELPPRTSTAKITHGLVVEWESGGHFGAAMQSRKVAEYLGTIKEGGGGVFPVWFTGELVGFWQGQPHYGDYLPKPVKGKPILGA